MPYYHNGLLVYRANEKPNKAIVNLWRHRCLERNENVLAAFVGQPGTGKTYAALAFACELPDFGPDHIVFNMRAFIQLVNGGTLRPGSVILYDEAEVDADNTRWASQFARSISHIMATIRSRNYIILFTMPFTTDILKKVRRLIQYNVECRGEKNYSKGYAFVRVRQNMPNHMTGEIYQQNIRIQVGRSLRTISQTRVWLPPRYVVNYYEARKLEFTSKLYKDISKNIEKNDEEESAHLSPTEEAYYYIACKYKPKTLEQIGELLREHGGISLNPQSISTLKSKVKKKGYVVGEKPAEYLERLGHNVEITKQANTREMVRMEKELETIEG